MCRIAAYLGPEIPLERLLIDPEHSLLIQSWAPRELRFARLNADGFGFGWFDREGQPEIYLNPAPIWADHNLPTLARTLRSDLWLAMVRSATPGFGNHIANTQPYRDGELLFTHNGYIERFRETARPILQRELSAEIESGILGNTDSEYIFALIRQLLTDDEELAIEAAIGEALGLIGDWAGEGGTALLNLVISDGERVYAARHAVNGECPSLYYSIDDERFPEGAQLVASEPLNDRAFWQTVPEHHILILDPDAPPELLAL
ncbi:ergothioneine biosynthesis protein EgtC [Acidihalobacter yilgarnensis]|uniref:Ergothioneine biosynthesis protein EgtC n=1 Tax=Acidihalobacter yilgarnensis TaxID=2819280 RepID=A0A1D8IL72_9GAMM|nr:ergothioneine biosynthesis protein EgtC [Acidihalobacter yilgarnensis]AOU97232.1 ergothioneine biosynthesis protein EgtC [Acidihalobacter yilgarnensis]